MNPRRRIPLLIFVMAIVAFGVGSIVILALYFTAIEQEEDHLREIVQGQARMIEAVARFDRLNLTDTENTFDLTLSQVKDAHSHFDGFGDTGEFVLVQYDAATDEIVFLLSHRDNGLTELESVPFTSENAEPARRALSNDSGGILKGVDYRGITVLAAYEPLAIEGEPPMGLIAKIDLSELRQPFIQAAIWAGVGAWIFILPGILLFLGIGNPMIRDIEQHEERLRRFTEAATESFTLWDAKLNLLSINDVGLSLFKTETHRQDIIGKNMVEISPEIVQTERVEQYLKVIKTGEPIILENISSKSNMKDRRLTVRAFKVGNGLGMITSDVSDRVRMESELRQSYDELELRVQERTTELVMANEHLQQEIREREQIERNLFESLSTTKLLYDFSRSLITANDLNTLLQMIADNLASALHADRVSLITIDESEKRVSQFIKSGPGKHHIVDVPFDELEKGLAGWVLRERESLLSLGNIPDPRENSEVQRRRIETNCGDIMIAPLQYGTGILGILTAINTPDDKNFTQQDLGFMVTLANQAAIAIENIYLMLSVKENESRFRAIFESSVDAIGVSVRGIHVSVNPAYLAMFGYEQVDDLIGQPVLALIAPSEHERIQDYIARRALNEDVTTAYEVRGIRCDGVEIDLEVRLSTYELKTQIYTVTVLRDITQRKQAELSLVKSQQFLSDIMNSVADSLFTVKMPDRYIEYVNSAMNSVFGYTREEVIGKTTRLFYADDAAYQAFGHKLQKALEKGQSRLHVEQELIKRDGEHFWAEISVTFLHTNGQLSQVISVVHDITERKHAEKQQLELMLERERMQILSGFITQASHEFRTPLSTINMSTYLLKGSTNPQMQEAHIHKIEMSVHYITDLVEALTTLSRLDGTRKLSKYPADLNEFVRGIYASREGIFNTKSIKGVLQLPTTPVMAAINGDYLKNALDAILDNAINFSQADDTITVVVRRDAQHAVIEVIDTGLGIAEDDLPHIFERFYRSDKAGTTRGFGLGLPIAKAVIELHGGHIELESVVDVGSTFRILLPITNVSSR